MKFLESVAMHVPLVRGLLMGDAINMRDPQDYETYRPEQYFSIAPELEQAEDRQEEIRLASGEIAAMQNSRRGI